MTLIGIDFGNNKEYLNKEESSVIKGIFILIVFYSHINRYTNLASSSDILMNQLSSHLGQLMVTLFLFYSGYGIFESIKNKKNYIKNLPKNRIFKTWSHFFIAVFSFWIISLITKANYPITRVLLSFIGWESIGNSNWYIFDIIVLYTLSFVSFTLFKNNHKKALALNTILSIIMIFILSKLKEPWWYNTILCYNFGMFYSYFKEDIDNIIFNNKKYIIITLLTSLLFVLFYKANPSIIQYELLSCIFSLLIVLITSKIKFNSKIIMFFGDNLFWIYILQRIPMILLSYYGINSHPYTFFILCFIITIILTYIYKFIIDKIDNKIFKKH